MQRLLLPFKRSMIICGYKTDRYKRAWGYPHYGIDISTYQGIEQKDHVIRAGGTGTLVWCEFDTAPTSLGWAIAIRYDNCIGRGGTTCSMIVRYMHASYYIDATGNVHDGKNIKRFSAGRVVHTGDPIAFEGNAGTKDPHVHLEMDTDLNFPQYTPQVAAGHSAWKKGTDTTINPSLWLWQSAEARAVPYAFTDRSWITSGVDDAIPEVPDDDPQERIALLEQRLAEVEREKDDLREIIENVRKAVSV